MSGVVGLTGLTGLTGLGGLVGLVGHRIVKESQVSGRPNPRLGQRHRGVEHPTGIQTATRSLGGVVAIEQSAPVTMVRPTSASATSPTISAIDVTGVMKDQFAGDCR